MHVLLARFREAGKGHPYEKKIESPQVSYLRSRRRLGNVGGKSSGTEGVSPCRILV